MTLPGDGYPQGPRCNRPRRFLRLVEVAEFLGVSKQRADQLCRRADFPVPAGRWARGDLWAAADIRRWARTYEGGENCVLAN
jgi:predicted DNA-binding transcriptional regulator AlpA